jgi:hypothetical protein
VAGGVGEFQWVILYVGVAVQGLRGVGGGHNGVGLYEAGEFGVVVAGVVEVEAGLVVELLAGVVRLRRITLKASVLFL